MRNLFLKKGKKNWEYFKKEILNQHIGNYCVLPPFTLIVDPTNKIHSGTHYLCEKWDYAFMILPNTLKDGDEFFFFFFS